MKTTLTLTLLLILVIKAHSQNDPLGPLMSVTEFTIKPGHDVQFQKGVKAWKACYLDVKGEWTWSVWQQQLGEGYVYLLASDMPIWAEMDKTDSVGSNCNKLLTEMIDPHIEKVFSHVTRLLPGVRSSTPTTDELISVGFYELNLADGHKFLPAIKEVSASLAKAEGSPRGYWYNWMTRSPDSTNYHFVSPYKNFAGMDVIRDSVWDVY